ncbi:tumor necrosis factor ligand superfamily member 13 [Bombina bombina]|uniref:tumor necrosis factor ligand superfamily member 13 n=1 Tax=Bombina bombina TaxID=8345 RepID=UPI00235ABDC8|nr:tumor necrosis factor ligand superfamily member 13 [Bombina bombina]
MSHMVRGCWSFGLARGLWDGTGAWLGVIVCLIALLCQSILLGNLQKELSLVQKQNEESRVEVREHRDSEQHSSSLCSRQKRDLASNRTQRHKGKRCVIHLVPESFSSDVSRDITLIFWKVSLRVGKSLSVQAASVRVKDSGIYYIYSQVLYHDNTFTMGQSVTRRAEEDTDKKDILLRCVQSMPSDEEIAYNTCYSAGVFQLQKGDIIQLSIPRHNASLDRCGQATFLGLVRL